MVSFTMVTASTTVGIPIAITGIANDFEDISFLLFPIPLPGSIPESVICIILFIFSTLDEAKASMAMI